MYEYIYIKKEVENKNVCSQNVVFSTSSSCCMCVVVSCLLLKYFALQGDVMIFATTGFTHFFNPVDLLVSSRF